MLSSSDMSAEFSIVGSRLAQRPKEYRSAGVFGGAVQLNRLSFQPEYCGDGSVDAVQLVQTRAGCAGRSLTGRSCSTPGSWNSAPGS